ncbi:hypothetical protein QTP86_014652 [Hemibagrus guttatus]|nr:hypothetical protein QTP86_014652 [Hemibagrus guttatus]
MSKAPFKLELDCRTDEEIKVDKKMSEAAVQPPMDTFFPEDHANVRPEIRISLANVNKLINNTVVLDDKFRSKKLFVAVASGDITKLEGLEEYLDTYHKTLMSKDYQPDGKTVLMIALLNLKNEDNKIVEYLLSIAEKNNYLNELVNATRTDTAYKGQTALHIAIERRKKRFVNLLIEKGADVHKQASGTFFQPLTKKCFYFGELPLSLAACINQKDIVDLLMERANVRRKDTLGNTVLHALVMVADVKSDNIDFVTSMYDYILAKDAAMNSRNKEKLEDIENNQELTPIKLAAKLGKIGLLQHILHREFLEEECRHLSRKFTEWVYGPASGSVYDLDSIDTYKPNSVLEIVVYGSEIPNRLEMLEIEPLNRLLEDKWNRFAKWTFYTRLFVYILYLIIFTTVSAYHYEEGTKNLKGYFLRAGYAIMAIGSLYFIIVVLIDLRKKRLSLQAMLIDGYSDLLFLFQAGLFVICMVLYFLGHQQYLAFLVLSLALSWINLLYFSRGSRHMGIYNIMIQKIFLGVIMRFLLVYIVFLIGFSAALVTLLNDHAERLLLNTVNTTVTEGCEKSNFKTISCTILELFKFTIGIGDLEFTEENKYKHVFYVMLIFYIVLTYILLLNMLIALMSKSVEDMSEKSTSIWKLQRAITILDMERYASCLKKKLRSGLKRNLGNTERWFLRVEEVNWKNCERNLAIISEDPGKCSTIMQSESSRGLQGSMDTVETFTLETDDRTCQERAKAKATRKDRQACGKDKVPMDTDLPEDHGDFSCQVRLNLNFSDDIQGIKTEPNKRDMFDIKRLFDAVSSGDVTRLEGLEEYLQKTNKKLTNSEYRPNGKTALMKALLNLRNGDNATVEHLLGIAERMGHLDKLVNSAYTDTYYEGQTALHIAIERRNKRFAALLIEKGADVHAKACGTFFQPLSETCFYFGELPLSLAACTNQKDIVDLLMEKADVRYTDTLGNTVLHALVMVADNSPENTDFVISMYDYILTKDAARNPKREKLEDIENNQRLTPIKLAAKLGKIGLFEHILHREFYQEGCRHLSRKFTEWAYGPVYASLYDLESLDTYEPNSVLEIVVYGTEIPNRLEMLQIEPLNKLLDDKWSRFAHRIFLFKFIVYLIYLAIFTTVSYHREEGNPQIKIWEYVPKNGEENILGGYLMLAGRIIMAIGSIYFLVSVLMNIKKKRPSLKTLLVDGYSELLFLFQGVFFIICMGLYLGGLKEYVAFLVLSVALCWVNLLYFSRGTRHMGIYSVMIQRMILSDILRFLFVYMVFLFGFSAAVVTLLKGDSEEPAEPAPRYHTIGRTLYVDVVGGCKKPSFKTIAFTTLELFKFTIGMGDLEFTEQYEYKHIFYVLLISYIVLTYILLLNMLIALMSKTVEKMSKESTSIWKLQRAITILDLERYACCLKTKLRSGVKRNLGKKVEDWRWCLRVEEVNWKKWNRNLGIISEDPGECSTVSLPSPQRAEEVGSPVGEGSYVKSADGNSTHIWQGRRHNAWKQPRCNKTGSCGQYL